MGERGKTFQTEKKFNSIVPLVCFQARGVEDDVLARGRCSRASPLQRRPGLGTLRGRGGRLHGPAAEGETDRREHGRAAEQERDQDLGGLAEGLRQDGEAVL